MSSWKSVMMFHDTKVATERGLWSDGDMNITINNNNNSNYDGSDNNGTFSMIGDGTEDRLPKPDGAGTDHVWTNVLAMGWVIVFLYCCCCKRTPPGREHWRGAEIRRRYQELLERERRVEAKKRQTPAYRRKLVRQNMRTKRVVGVDEDGNWTLGSLTTCIDAAALPSPTTNDCVITLQQEQQLLQQQQQQQEEEEADNEEEHCCVICLDSFAIGDVVSWARVSDDCHHVFHAECIRPWLEGQRQDECPSCRHRLLIEEPPDECSGDEEIREEEVDENDGHDDDDDDEDDLELGNDRNTASDRENKGVSDGLYNGGEEDEEEEDSFFVIVHGLIARAARRASYTLIGTKASMDGGTATAGSASSSGWVGTSLPPASPLRRVMSHEPTPSPPTMIVGGMRRIIPSRAAPPELSLHHLMGHQDRYRQVRTTGSSDDDEDGMEQDRLALEGGFGHVDAPGNGRCVRLVDDSVLLRRVQSDIGSTRSRLGCYPMLREKKTNETASSNNADEDNLNPPKVVRHAVLNEFDEEVRAAKNEGAARSEDDDGADDEDALV